MSYDVCDVIYAYEMVMTLHGGFELPDMFSTICSIYLLSYSQILDAVDSFGSVLHKLHFHL